MKISLALWITESRIFHFVACANEGDRITDGNFLRAGKVYARVHAERTAVGRFGTADTTAEIGVALLALRVDDLAILLATPFRVFFIATLAGIFQRKCLVAELPRKAGAAAILRGATEQAVVAHAVGTD